MATIKKEKKAETEDIARPCRCSRDLIEGSLTINGSEVRFYRCPKCNAFTYLPDDLQKAVFRLKPNAGGTKGEDENGHLASEHTRTEPQERGRR